jgi:hypothetical protein
MFEVSNRTDEAYFLSHGYFVVVIAIIIIAVVFILSNRGGSGSFSVQCIWDLCWAVDGYHRLGGTYCAHLQAHR